MSSQTANVFVPRRLTTSVPSILVDGHQLDEAVLTGWAYGPEVGDAPTIVVIGGITASPFPFGNPEAPEIEAWWPALLGPGLIDPSTTTVLCPCWPGNGSTWQGFDDAPLPALSVLGLADLLAAWLDGIGCHDPVTIVGASLGGMVATAFTVCYAKQVARLVTISAGLRPDGWGTAVRHLQREIVRDAMSRGDVATGMVRARQLGMLTYRGRGELDVRFGKLLPGLERPPVAEYLDHQGKRFAARFPVKTFLLLSEAIDRGSITHDADELRSLLENVVAETIVVGVPGDMLFPWALQVELHRELQAAGASSSLWKLDSEFGHDAFLADQDKLAELLKNCGAFGLLGKSAASRTRYDGIGKQPIRELRIGMIGCGTVGGGLLEMLEREKAPLAERYGVQFRVTKIAVRDVSKDRGPHAAGIALTTHPLDVVSDPEVDVVVEVAGGMAMEPVLRAALAQGKPVVTANKALLASKLAELGILAQRTETPLYCEAAAAAAIPIIRHLSHRADEVDSFLGIVNGTCNFVITRLEAESTFEDAITTAQRQGFAEADPSADIDGLDAAAKLSILAYRAFGAWLRPNEFPVRGIRDLDPADCDLAEAMGFRIRLIAHASRVGEALHLAVEPVLLPTWHLLASVEEEYNAVYLKCVSSGDLSLFGKGAGALPTATAVLGDLIDLAQDNSVGWPEPRAISVASEAPARRHYLRVSAEAHPGLERRIDSFVRQTGLLVQSRAQRGNKDRVHLGFLISACSSREIAELQAVISKMARVERSLSLGVIE